MAALRLQVPEDLSDLVTTNELTQAMTGLDTVAARQQAVAAVSDSLAGKASTAALSMVANTIPQLSNDTPQAESKTGSAGSMGKVPHADHQHPRLTSSTAGTTAADGTATMTFTRSFATLPGVVLTAIENTTSAGPSLKVQKWKTKNAQGQLVDRSTSQGSAETYDGCVVYAWRGRALPTQQPVNVLSLLAGVITGLNSLITALSGYETYVPAGNVSFTCVAVQSSAS